MQFALDSFHGTFEGTVNDRDDQITGMWRQSGKKALPLTFKRATPDATPANSDKDYGQGLSSQVEGHWNGAPHVKAIELHVPVHIASLSDGLYSATMDSPDQGASGVPATAVEFNRPDLRIEWKVIGGLFTAKLENGRLEGTWRQGGLSLPLKLERSQ